MWRCLSASAIFQVLRVVENTECLAGIEKGDEKEQQTQHEVHAKRRHVAGPAALQVVVGKEAGLDQQGNERLPQARVQLENVAERIADEFPQANEAIASALTAVATILSPHVSAAIQALGHFAGRQLFRSVLAQDAFLPHDVVAE